MRTGTFDVAPGPVAAADTAIGGLRGSSIAPPGGSFAALLKDELDAALRAAGLQDPTSAIIVEGRLTDNRLDASGISVGTARLAARFVVTRDRMRVFERELAVDARWESSFVGAIAIPAATNQYGAIYKTLVGRLFEDPDFRVAVARR